MKVFTPLKVSKITVILLVCIFSNLFNSVFATSIAAISDGDWASTTTWSGGVVPSTDDDVTITGFTVTVSTNIGTIKSLTVESSATLAGKLIVQSGGTLAASTDLIPLILKGGEIENAGTLSLTTTGTATYCIQYDNTGSGMLVTAGKYSGSGVLTLNCITSTVGAAIRFAQTNAVGVFTVGGTYNFEIYQERPIFIVAGSALIDGTGTITAGTSDAPAAYGLITLAASSAQITINDDVTLNTYTSISSSKRGPIYIGSFNSMILTNKGVINIQGSGANGISAIVTSTINNEGTINISGAFTESAIGMNVTNGNVLSVNNTGSISISGISNGVAALATPGTSGYMTFTNNTNAVLDINAGNTGIATGSRTRLRNYGGILKGSGIYNGNFEPETGTISPGGDGIGKITISKLQLLTVNTNYLSGKCILNVNGKSTAGTDFDQIVFTQSVVNVSNSTIEAIIGSLYSPVFGDNIPLISAVSCAGNFSSSVLPANSTLDYSFSDAIKLTFGTTGTSLSPISLIKIYGADGKMVINNAEGKNVNVYSIDGKKIYFENIKTSKTSIEMGRGIYLVDIDNVKCKICVR